MILRGYQRECRDAVEKTLERDHGTLMVMATGLGKTIVFGHVAHAYVKRGQRVLLLAHRTELLEQGAQKLRRITGDWVDVEQADKWADAPRLSDDRAQIIVSTVQTLAGGWGGRSSGKKRFQRFNWKEFGLVIRDEAHHVATKSDLAICNHIRAENPDVRFLGPTATPDRHDNRSLDCLFDSCAYRYEAWEAIEHGWLVPPRALAAVIHEVNLDAIEVKNRKFNDGQLDDEMMKNAAGVARAAMDYSEGRKTLVFCAGVASAQATCDALNSTAFAPGQARIITGKTPDEDRAAIWSAYRMNEFRFLVNVAVATEGVDLPDVQCIVCAKPTLSRVVYSQQIGRGLRPLDGLLDDLGEDHPTIEGLLPRPSNADAARRERIAQSAKPDCLIVDIVGNTSRHDIITAAHALAGDRFDAELLDEAGKIDGDVREAVHKAKLQREERNRIRAEKAAREAERVAEWNRRNPQVSMTAHDVAMGRGGGAVWRGAPGDKVPSEKQLKILRMAGVDRDGLSYSHIKAIIGVVFREKEKTGDWKSGNMIARAMADKFRRAPHVAQAAAPHQSQHDDLWEFT